MANSKRRCLGCKCYFKAETMIDLPIGGFHSRDCAVEYARKPTPEKAERVRKLEKKEDSLRVKKFNTNDTQKQHELTQPVFNKLRRLQEMEWFKENNLQPECISCGKNNMDWCNGHYKTVKSQGALRYDPINSYLQCNRYCNKALSGNISGNKNSRGYEQGLIDRFGEKCAADIIDYCSIDRVRKWTGPELQQMRADFNKQIRELEGK